MTDLQAYKMPIIEGINSTPSTDADPTHPNASLFCQKYNNLIDSLSMPAASAWASIDLIYNEYGTWEGSFTAADGGSGFLSVPLEEGWTTGTIYVWGGQYAELPGFITSHGVIIYVDEFGAITFNAWGKTPAGSFSFQFGIVQTTTDPEVSESRTFVYQVNLIVVPAGSGSGSGS